MSALLCGLVAAIGWGTADYLAAICTRRVGTLRTTLGMQASSLALLAITAAGFGQLPVLTVETAALAVAMGALGSVMLAALYRALAIGPIAIVSPIVAANAAVTVILAVALLGERLSASQLVAAVATIAGVALASTDLGIVRDVLRARKRRLASEAGNAVPAASRLALVTMVGFGVLGFALATVSRSYGAVPMVVLLRAGTTALLAAVALARRRSPFVPVGAALLIALVGVLDTTGNLAYGAGATIGYASIVATASSTYPLIPFALGLTVLRERVAPNQLAGVALLLAGLLGLGLVS